MTTGPEEMAPPKDYRLLVPRDWFRIDLTRDRWRAQLRTFVDRQARGKGVTAEVKGEAWAALRNTAEAGVRDGALEFFLRPELEDGRIMPASLIVSVIPRTGSLTPEVLRQSFEARDQEKQRAAEVSIVGLPAGESVQIVTLTTMDLYVQMPGAVGYLTLGFSVPLSGMAGPMRRLCTSIAESLRWIV